MWKITLYTILEVILFILCLLYLVLKNEGVLPSQFGWLFAFGLVGIVLLHQKIKVLKLPTKQPEKNVVTVEEVTQETKTPRLKISTGRLPQLNFKVFLALILTTSLIVTFWWYGVRPSEIRQECSWTSRTKTSGEVYWVSASEREYEICLRHSGL